MIRLNGVGFTGLLVTFCCSAFGQDCTPPEPVRSDGGHFILQLLECPKPEDNRHFTNKPFPDLHVEIKTAQGHQIPGAAVEFTFPGKGPSADFRAPCRTDPASDGKVLCTTTNAEGFASATRLKANNIAGEVKIRVNASFGGETAFTEIHEYNSRLGFYTRNKKKLWISGAAAAAVVITVVLLRPGSKPSATIGTVAGTGPVSGP